MSKKVTLIHRSGERVEFLADDAEFYVSPPEDEEGNPNPNAGNLSGYRIDAGEKMPVFWTRVDQIDLVMVENSRTRKPATKKAKPPTTMEPR